MYRLLAVGAAALFIAGCSRQETSDSLRARTETAAQEAKEERREWENRVEARLNKIDRDIEERKAETKENWKKGKIKSRDEYNERLSELDRMKAEARGRLADAKSASKETWEDMKRGMDSAADKLESAWNRFLEDLKS